jgi:very-short-patch-repair endonuclease
MRREKLVIIHGESRVFTHQEYIDFLRDNRLNSLEQDKLSRLQKLKEYQFYYNLGYTWDEVGKKFGINGKSLRHLAMNGKLKSRPVWSERSYPERIFINALAQNEISGWICEYRNGRYRYDIAFPDIKLDVEIDGTRHNLPEVKKRDIKRDKFSKEQGWTVLRFPTARIIQDLNSCIYELSIYLNSNQTFACYLDP